MTSIAAETALAAGRTRLLAERLPMAERDELIEEWSEMLEAMDDARSTGAAELVLIAYREGIERRLAATRRHSPALEEIGR
jgi:hypothetical protein